MQSNNLVIGLPPIKSTIPLYDGCIFFKHFKSSYRATRVIVLLTLINTDICRSMCTPFLGSVLYFLTFIDDFSKFTHIYFASRNQTFCVIFKISNH